jgi:hypothetical protein
MVKLRSSSSTYTLVLCHLHYKKSFLEEIFWRPLIKDGSSLIKDAMHLAIKQLWATAKAGRQSQPCPGSPLASHQLTRVGGKGAVSTLIGIGMMTGMKMQQALLPSEAPPQVRALIAAQPTAKLSSLRASSSHALQVSMDPPSLVPACVSVCVPFQNWD